LTTLIGWGGVLPVSKTTEQEYSPKLLETELAIASFEECRAEFWPKVVGKSQMCAGPASPDSAGVACHGDSGGPLFANVQGFGHVQVGIVSFGKLPCGGVGAMTGLADLRLPAISSFIARCMGGALPRASINATEFPQGSEGAETSHAGALLPSFFLIVFLCTLLMFM
jgi:secreted trypsin-like serine protease